MTTADTSLVAKESILVEKLKKKTCSLIFFVRYCRYYCLLRTTWVSVNLYLVCTYTIRRLKVSVCRLPVCSAYIIYWLDSL